MRLVLVWFNWLATVVVLHGFNLLWYTGSEFCGWLAEICVKSATSVHDTLQIEERSAD